ncbi:proton-conducting transporter membrane subunit [Haloarcula onubensis]|uniref:Cation:proton antiporter n=1 Tax=Haloarcula onubensis TaxID=2950539 RepID=A0ABU2FR05_9EURY|nr:proton-conducting transporter membrane subunit [Halomicroarcula sp. S3CR25-11]MDS0282667.1 cation:proton antiporter [Halomicroarcula sp. S3CR25-11]
MNDLLLSVPPWVAFLLAAAVAFVAPRRIGYLVGVLATAITVPWLLLAPAESTLVVSSLGFEQTLYRVDALARPVAAVFGVAATLAVAYAYATDADARTNAYALAHMGVAVAAVLVGDWLSLLVAWELLAVTATVLVWHHGGTAVRPGFRYAVYHLVGGALLVAAVVLHYTAVGTFAMGVGFADGLPTALAVLGVGVNLGFVGLHYWVPDTYPRPHVAASVVLAGFTTKVAVYALARVVPDGSALVAWMGGAMVLYAVWMAVLQTDVRRLLSYHIVSQVGYMVAAIGVGTAAGTAGAVAHLSTHVLYKGLLFMVAGALLYRTGTESLKRLGGLGRRMPLTFAVFLVAALAISGVPGFSGFVSKGLVLKAVEQRGGDLLWWALVIGGVGTVLSFAKVGYYAFVRTAPEPLDVRPAPLALSAVLLVAAVPSIAFGLAPDLLYGALPGDTGGFAPYAAAELTKVALVTAAGVLAFATLRDAIARVPSADVDRLLHPVAFRLATASADAVIAAGRRADGALATALSRSTDRLADDDRRDPLGGRFGTTLLVVAAALGVALLVAQLG